MRRRQRRWVGIGVGVFGCASWWVDGWVVWSNPIRMEGVAVQFLSWSSVASVGHSEARGIFRCIIDIYRYFPQFYII